MTDSPPQASWYSLLRHELSNPINSIIGYSELLGEELADFEDVDSNLLSEKIEILQTQGYQLLRKLKNILPSSLTPLVPDSHLYFNDEQATEKTRIHEELCLELLPLAANIEEACQDIITNISEPLISDVQKIQTAVEALLTLINTVPDLSLSSLQIKISQESKEVSDNLTSSDGDSNISLGTAHILVVDDNDNNCELLARKIIEQGYFVTTVANGKQAIQCITTGNYDLILLDLIMPEMNGYQVLEWLAKSEWRYTPVIMISALDELDSVVKCIEMGAEDYLPKPFNQTLLKARIGACLEKKYLRDQETLYLAQITEANQQITRLNEQLKAENLRLSTELEVARRLQQMILPKVEELKIAGLDIVGFMQPTEEVGGDYYDIVPTEQGVRIGIGDVTGHGLESGILMLMVQTAIRTLCEADETSLVRILQILNQAIYANVKRMDLDRHLTLCLLDYQNGILKITGQHERVIIVRNGGELQLIETLYLGFYIGFERDINDLFNTHTVGLELGDTLVLYTDGIIEAENRREELYGFEQLCRVIQQHHHLTAFAIQQAVIEDVQTHLEGQKLNDDITLIVMKRV
ncbi:SpoIIE family protein phosphatase [Spirulina subsalsa]|uniref:SpoIIE family protein phosphatase n=1 Tax=Spirulina subsalsa TaxID=54311 RepID=UPI0002D36419|nr:SpoIIE family protein phosphatase [Spirulina subsalsa]